MNAYQCSPGKLSKMHVLPHLIMVAVVMWFAAYMKGVEAFATLPPELANNTAIGLASIDGTFPNSWTPIPPGELRADTFDFSFRTSLLESNGQI